MTPQRILKKQQKKLEQQKQLSSEQQSSEQSSSSIFATALEAHVPVYTGPSYTYEELCLARELVDMANENEEQNWPVRAPWPAHVVAACAGAEQARNQLPASIIPKQLVEPRLRRDGMGFTREEPSVATVIADPIGSAQDMPSAENSADEGVLDLSLKKPEDNKDQEVSNQGCPLCIFSQQSQDP